MMSRQGIKNIANRIHGLAAITATALRSAGFGVDPTPFFDTIKINVSTKGEEPGTPPSCTRRLGCWSSGMSPQQRYH